MEHLRKMGENLAPFLPSSITLSRDVMIAAASIYQSMYGNDDGSIPVTFQVR
jgi:NADH dehydrogenase [ubiquinone] 1 alpha subcomplex assembly factor 5